MKEKEKNSGASPEIVAGGERDKPVVERLR